MRMSAPRVYIAGPGFVQYDTPQCVPTTPEGPSIFLGSRSDEAFALLQRLLNVKWSEQEILGFTGVAPPSRKPLTTAMMEGATQMYAESCHLFDLFKHGSFKNPDVQFADAEVVSKLTFGLVKGPDESTKAIIRKNADAASNIVQLFCWQNFC